MDNANINENLNNHCFTFCFFSGYLESTVEHAIQRKQFGKSIKDFGLIQVWLVLDYLESGFFNPGRAVASQKT